MHHLTCENKQLLQRAGQRAAVACCSAASRSLRFQTRVERRRRLVWALGPLASSWSARRASRWAGARRRRRGRAASGRGCVPGYAPRWWGRWGPSADVRCRWVPMRGVAGPRRDSPGRPRGWREAGESVGGRGGRIGGRRPAKMVKCFFF